MTSAIDASRRTYDEPSQASLTANSLISLHHLFVDTTRSLLFGTAALSHAAFARTTPSVPLFDVPPHLDGPNCFIDNTSIMAIMDRVAPFIATPLFLSARSYGKALIHRAVRLSRQRTFLFSAAFMRANGCNAPPTLLKSFINPAGPQEDPPFFSKPVRDLARETILELEALAQTIRREEAARAAAGSSGGGGSLSVLENYPGHTVAVVLNFFLGDVAAARQHALEAISVIRGSRSLRFNPPMFLFHAVTIAEVAARWGDAELLGELAAALGGFDDAFKACEMVTAAVRVLKEDAERGGGGGLERVEGSELIDVFVGEMDDEFDGGGNWFEGSEGVEGNDGGVETAC